jgi:hypothetical protein
LENVTELDGNEGKQYKAHAQKAKFLTEEEASSGDRRMEQHENVWQEWQNENCVTKGYGHAKFAMSLYNETKPLTPDCKIIYQ